MIAFIGETQFAPGEWAGIVLDQPVGKNDGSVSGVRYFQCEVKRGVFARLSKLTTKYVEGGQAAATSAAPPTSTIIAAPSGGVMVTSTPAKQPQTANGASYSGRNGPSATPTAPVKSVGATPKVSGIRRSSVSGSTSNLKSSPSGSVTNVTTVDLGKHRLNVGDRVLIGGTKIGVLRFVGGTDFAKGDWAGVELDEPLGKNDGAVAGKR